MCIFKERSVLPAIAITSAARRPAAVAIRSLQPAATTDLFMKTDDLRAFDAVIRYGSISEAARSMDLTQSAITRRIQNLEEALGAQLLDRSTKPPHPSLLGLRVHEQTKAALREIDALAALVTSDAEPTGRLRLGLTHSMGASGLIDVITGMNKRFPGVEMQLSADWSAALMDRVTQGNLDAATVFLPPNAVFPEALGSHKLVSTDVVIVAAKGRFDSLTMNVRNYVEAGWILNPEGCGFRAAVQRKLSDLGLRFHLNMETFGSELQLGLVAAGLGLGFVSRPALEASRYAKSLSIVCPRDFKYPIDIWLVAPHFHGNLDRAVQHFGQAIGTVFSASPKRETAP
jgi:DNA-binding transcriptional LysR family regulator